MSKVVKNTFMGGRWLQRYQVGGKYTWTISGSRWNNIKDRCNPNGKLQVREPSYAGTINAFKGWEEFVEWDMSQIGHSEEDYQVDSDILNPGVKTYSRDTCLLIPARLNKFLQTRSVSLKPMNLPEGLVISHADPTKIHCKISSWFTGSKFLGAYSLDQVDIAHSVYLKEKNYHRELWVEKLRQMKVDPRVIDYMQRMRFTKEGKELI